MGKAKHIIYYGLSRSFMIAVVTSVIVYLNASKLVLIFTDIQYIQDTAVTYLRLLSLVYPLVAIAMPAGRILQGFGLGLPTLVITLIRVLLVASPLSLYFIFIQNRPVEWVWYSMMISTAVAFVVAVGWIMWALKKYTFQPMGVQHEKTQFEPN